jgi:hypothetical protein
MNFFVVSLGPPHSPLGQCRQALCLFIPSTQIRKDVVVTASVADPQQVDADPDSACHFDADPDPSYQKMLKTLFLPFNLMRIRIRTTGDR